MKTINRLLKVQTQEKYYPRTIEAFQVFRKLHAKYGATCAFLLDSVTDLKSRYCSSVIGLFPLVACRLKGHYLQLEGHESIVPVLADNLRAKGYLLPAFEGPLPPLLDAIQKSFELQQPDLKPYSFGFIGYFAYDAIRYFEDIPNTTVDDRGLDDVLLQIHQVIFHFEPDRIRIVINEIPGVETPDFSELEALLASDEPPAFKGFDPAGLVIQEDVKKEQYLERVNRAKEYIREGDIFQVVLSKRDRVIGEIDPLLVYQRLKEVNPSPYMFYVDYGEYRIFGASPEMQIRMENGIAQMRPIAGTTKGKGSTEDENRRLIENLLGDEKEKAEHLMLVDLCRNDLGRVCKAGSIHVKDFMVVEEYSHVFHIVSTVEGEVEKQVLPFDVFLSTFPAGTLSGAPKVRAMEIIDELEHLSRGPYGGVIGFMDFLGNMNTAIVIRTIVNKDGVSYLQAGAGIVADSVPENEWNECDHKLRALKTTVFS
ncbi:anthranilate synthase component I family protein [Effusibacillus lacus]|uniref:Anthranilate synthase component 1 n=1 Tax=Effusibacillus lacus TaxID=1348429 RepID=A0A292YLY3_9BACL|nr:chorismate-binding protein [Effusibacillus lacus]TCS68054.1 anthranilate synthase component I [Effusibacillus lacus]GAX90948.1 anthranilate synthase component I [Effusibacillus lacus]